MLQKKIRLYNMHLFTINDLCNCKACQSIREMQVTLKVLEDILTVIKGDRT